MKRYLLSEQGNFYKANLHCHTSLSDALYTPEEVKKQYMEHGSSIVAYTDHDIFVPHPELADENFLPLNGYEIEVTEGYENGIVSFGEEFKMQKSCHICLIALEPDNAEQICWHREWYQICNSGNHMHLVKYDETKEDYIRTHTPECICNIMKQGRDNRFFVTYNHPVWSLENSRDYLNYHHMHAMEIYNHASYVSGYPDENPFVYDDMLRGGERIYCIAADDNHGSDMGTKKCDSFGGFTMIKAPALEYRSVTDALVRGDFYASNGPIIDELWFEDDSVHIKCPGADRITLSTGRRRADSIYDEVGKGLTYASFKVFKNDVYFRLTVEDTSGKRAYTNAYFTEEFFE